MYISGFKSIICDFSNKLWSGHSLLRFGYISSIISIEHRLTSGSCLTAVLSSCFWQLDSMFCLDFRVSLEKNGCNFCLNYWTSEIYPLGLLRVFDWGNVFSSFLSSFNFLLTLIRISGLPLRKFGWENIFLVGSFLDLWKPYIFNWDKLWNTCLMKLFIWRCLK